MKYKYILALFGATILWGLGFAGVQMALDASLGPFFISATRFLIGSMVLLILLYKKNPLHYRINLQERNCAWYVFIFRIYFSNDRTAIYHCF